jgi:hypothetical protein
MIAITSLVAYYVFVGAGALPPVAPLALSDSTAFR